MWIFLTVGAMVSAYFLFEWWRARRRRTIFSKPLPDEWREILLSNVSLYTILPVKLREELHGHINVFIAEKEFVGCAGLEITDEMRVTIAAYACVLLLNRKAHYYPNVLTVLVYPSTFIGEQTSWDGIVKTVGKQARLGEAWRRGPIVLSWDSVLQGALDLRDGHNVVLHEFAHKLDALDGAMDGAPDLKLRSRYISWARVMKKEFSQLQKQVEAGDNTVLDYYGATEPVEFFAVLTETFFEKPHQLATKHPELYEETKKFFELDPASWS